MEEKNDENRFSGKQPTSEKTCSCTPICLGGMETGAREINPGCWLHGEGSIWQTSPQIPIEDLDYEASLSLLRHSVEQSMGMWCAHGVIIKHGCPVCHALPLEMVRN